MAAIIGLIFLKEIKALLEDSLRIFIGEINTKAETIKPQIGIVYLFMHRNNACGQGYSGKRLFKTLRLIQPGISAIIQRNFFRKP